MLMMDLMMFKKTDHLQWVRAYAPKKNNRFSVPTEDLPSLHGGDHQGSNLHFRRRPRHPHPPLLQLLIKNHTSQICSHRIMIQLQTGKRHKEVLLVKWMMNALRSFRPRLCTVKCQTIPIGTCIATHSWQLGESSCLNKKTTRTMMMMMTTMITMMVLAASCPTLPFINPAKPRKPARKLQWEVVTAMAMNRHRLDQHDRMPESEDVVDNAKRVEGVGNRVLLCLNTASKSPVHLV
mmetsp:Transcript_25039/g.52053  ORF Transcript_25039/g.52053 Transcript_25039/m.52053 type:complete len:236 (-) Transcript_25039:1488-2195(-)